MAITSAEEANKYREKEYDRQWRQTMKTQYGTKTEHRFKTINLGDDIQLLYKNSNVVIGPHNRDASKLYLCIINTRDSVATAWHNAIIALGTPLTFTQGSGGESVCTFPNTTTNIYNIHKVLKLKKRLTMEEMTPEQRAYFENKRKEG